MAVNKNTEITFEILKHIAVLSRKKDGWTKEANIVTWNGGPPKLDIREWDQNHERMTRGLTFTEEDSLKMKDILKQNTPDEEDFPVSESTEQLAEVSFQIKKHLGRIATRKGSEMPWHKEVNIVSWNGGTPKIDIRDWSDDHERMARGITLTREEAIALSEAKFSVPFLSCDDAADEVVDRIVNYFLESPLAKLKRNKFDDVEVEEKDGAYILPLTFNGKEVKIAVEEVK